MSYTRTFKTEKVSVIDFKTATSLVNFKENNLLGKILYYQKVTQKQKTAPDGNQFTVDKSNANK